jgi:hypothetical protein
MNYFTRSKNKKYAKSERGLSLNMNNYNLTLETRFSSRDIHSAAIMTYQRLFSIFAYYNRHVLLNLQKK